MMAIMADNPISMQPSSKNLMKMTRNLTLVLNLFLQQLSLHFRTIMDKIYLIDAINSENAKSTNRGPAFAMKFAEP